MHRPTKNTLLYLTKVRGHEIRRGPQTVDPYVLRALRDFLTEPELAEFFQYTRSFYTIEGHYSNLWHYDKEITPRPTHPAYQAAVEHVRGVLRLPQPAQSSRWDELSKVPFIPSSGSGYGYRGKKGAPGNHETAVSRAVWHLNTWLERPDTYRYTPDLAWTRTQLGHLDAPKIRNVWGKLFTTSYLKDYVLSPL
ncbi:hypothetical protein BC332_34887 [Capsicum chinense]|nr:hypothetical protein BC332_34887 [Capsicum chinense]